MSKAEFTCTVVPAYLEDQSQPERHEYAFSYTVTIVNTGEVAAQLVGRRWTITDAQGRIEEVRGLAVVGHQPLLKPGERFEYTSWARIATPQGTMRGTYLCMTEDTEAFEAPVPEFALARVEHLH